MSPRPNAGKVTLKGWESGGNEKCFQLTRFLPFCSSFILRPWFSWVSSCKDQSTTHRWPGQDGQRAQRRERSTHVTTASSDRCQADEEERKNSDSRDGTSISAGYSALILATCS